MTPPTDPSAGSRAAPPPAAAAARPPLVAQEPRQRWRLTFTRAPVAPDAVGRAALDAWQETLVASGLPLAGLEPGGTGRARIAIGAPLPAMASGEAELADIWLLERSTAWQVREALADRLPADHGWVRAEDVWLAAPALAGRVAAADWRVTLAGAAPSDRPRRADAVRSLLAARSLVRTRLKGGAEKRYDLRPLLADVSIPDAPAQDAIVARIRTRFDPEAGAGRPEEVVAALADTAVLPLVIGSIARERLVLADDIDGSARRR